MCISASAKLSSKCKSRKISINLAARMSSFSRSFSFWNREGKGRSGLAFGITTTGHTTPGGNGFCFSLRVWYCVAWLMKSRWTCLTRNILTILNEITDCCGLKLLDVIMKDRIIVPSSGEWTLIIAMI
uniref:Uncharacterized protein n=1 Tax=Tanacetum cinerariifolium TaxID=118510 RepID=A0A699Q9H3_TANCI|nr:hypothetical protein [Tanacetum cinerariifolium]